MPAFSIDRLTLELPGVSGSHARRLALGIGESLAAASLAGGNEVPTMRVDLTANAGGDANRLARQIVEEILRQLQCSP